MAVGRRFALDPFGWVDAHLAPRDLLAISIPREANSV